MPDNSTWYGRAARAFGDTVNIGVNTATAGLLNRGIGALMGASGEQVDKMNQGMRQRTGVGGDLAAGLGAVYGLGKASRAAGAVSGAVRAAPTAVALVPTAGIGTAARFLVGRAGPGLVPAVARATAPKASTVLKAAAGLGIVGGAVANGMSSRVTPAATGVGPQGKYTPEQLAARDEYLANPVESSLAAGRAATAALTPYDRQLAALDTIFKSPNATLTDLQAATAMLPAVPKQGTKKDAAFGQTAELSRAIFEQQIASISAQKDAGEIDDAQAQLATKQAMEAEFQRQSGMQGLNPMNIMQAQMMAPDEESQ